MKKLITTILTVMALSSTSAVAIVDCTQFEKISAKYLECTAKNLKSKSKDIKKKMAKKSNQQKEKFNKSNLKKKLIKLKNSKTLTNFVEKE